jgi:hypothetical protein
MIHAWRSMLLVFLGLLVAVPLIACRGGSKDSDQGTIFTPEVGMICVSGDVQGNNNVISADSPVHISLYPKGCFSSSCTDKLETSCSVTGDSTLTVTGSFLLSTRDGTCTPDCSGGGFAGCDSQNLSPGDHIATVGDLSVNFTVPSSIPLDPASLICAGSPF